jgi:hypothetical protein
MTAANQTMPTFAARLWGLGALGIGVLGLIWGSFNPAQPVPEDFPARTALAYVAAVFMLFGGGRRVASKCGLGLGGVIVFADSAKLDAALAARLKRLAQLTFGVCALVFGAAHFEFMNHTASLVPKWLLPSQEFWAVATGLCHIARESRS